MPTHCPDTTSTWPEQAELENLAAELATCGYHTDLCTPDGEQPYLHVVNPQASALTENVFSHDGRYYWSWAEPITACSQPATAAAILARVLRTTDGQ